MLVFLLLGMIIQCLGPSIVGTGLQKMMFSNNDLKIKKILLIPFLFVFWGMHFENVVVADTSNFLNLTLEQREKKVLDQLLSVHGPDLNQLIGSQKDKNEIKRILRSYIQSPQSLELFSKLQDWQKTTAQENALSSYGLLIDLAQKSHGVVVSETDRSFLNSLRREMQAKPTDIMALKWYEAIASTGSAWGLELLIDSVEQLPANEVASRFKLIDLMDQHFFRDVSQGNHSNSKNGDFYVTESSDYQLFSKVAYHPLTQIPFASRINSQEQQKKFVQQYAEHLKQLEIQVGEQTPLQKPLQEQLQKMYKNLVLAFPGIEGRRGTASFAIEDHETEDLRALTQSSYDDQQRQASIVDLREKNLRQWEQKEKNRIPAQKNNGFNGSVNQSNHLYGNENESYHLPFWLLLAFPILLLPMLRQKFKNKK